MAKELSDHSPFSEGEKTGRFTVVDEPGLADPPRKVVTLPRLQGAGVRKVLKCQLLQEFATPSATGDTAPSLQVTKGMIRVGDHFLVVAKVLEILGRNVEDSGEQGGYGLSYVDGKYRQVGEPISLRA